ncbi:MAG: signal peptidase I [Synechococcales cyanobacterium RM1_1_8]|nr:signal peptidase I [Synechococcales cyanobacterium RM1_1_8]
MNPSDLPSPWYAVNLSLLFPGIGHFYGGRWARGLLWLGLGLGLLGLTLWSFLGKLGDVRIGAGCMGMGLMLWLFSAIDAYSCVGAGSKPQVFRSFASQSRRDTPTKDIWFAVFLSQLWPGLGQLYAHHWLASVVFLGLGIVLLALGAFFTTAMVLWLVLLALSCGLLPQAAPSPKTSGSPQTVSPQIISTATGERPKAAVRRQAPNGIGLALLILVVRLLMFSVLGLSEQWIEPFGVPSESMLPTLEVGDRILVSKLADYRPQAGDIIVFNSRHGLSPEGKPETLAEAEAFVKRVIATPGDRLTIQQGQVILNGQTLIEPYIAEPVTYELAPQELAPNQYFVLGDNRNFSFDSHLWGPWQAKTSSAKPTELAGPRSATSPWPTSPS